MVFYHPSNKPKNPSIFREIFSGISFFLFIISYIVGMYIFINNDDIKYFVLSIVLLRVVFKYIQDSLVYSKNIKLHEEYKIESEKEKIQQNRKRKADIKAFNRQRTANLKESIVNLLKEHGEKMPASDIDAQLRHQNVDEIKKFCKEMHINGEISRTGNWRYYIKDENT